MPLDPALAGMLAMVASADQPPLRELSAAQARQGTAQLFAMMTAALGGPRTVVGTVNDDVVPGPAGPIPVRVYHPAEDSPAGSLPTTVLFHGGGFVLCDLDTHDDLARLICRGSGGIVVSVDYRLAPEHPYPAGGDDCEAAVRHVLDDIGAYGGDPARVGVAGDSAGGCLAAVVTQRLAARPGAHPLAAQLLLYPAVDLTESEQDHPSRRANGEGYLLTADDMRWFGEQYTGGADRTRPDVSPLLALDLGGLPPAIVATAEFDPLRDEGNAYAARLATAGVPVEAFCFDGLIHGFGQLGIVSPAAQLATDTAIDAYAQLLG